MLREAGSKWEGRDMFGLAAASKSNMTRLAERMGPYWPLRSALARPLSQVSDGDLDRALAAAGKTRAQLFVAAPGNASHRRRMAHLMAHFGVAPDIAVLHFWDELRRADERCCACRSQRRCQSWLDWPISADAPRIFCPNAPAFDAIAQCRTVP